MGFGLRDSSWVDPPEQPEFNRPCIYCEYFIACPCGCQWGICELDKNEMFDGTKPGCEYGIPIDGIYEEEPDDGYSAWRDDRLSD